MELLDPNLPPLNVPVTPGNMKDVYPDYLTPPLKGEGWSSAQATEMLLNNLFYMTAKVRRLTSKYTLSPFMPLLQILVSLLLLLYLYTIFDQRRVEIIDEVEYGVHDRLYIYPLCGIFYFPWHIHHTEGTNGFWCLFRMTLVKGDKGNCESFQAASVGFAPVTTNRQSCAITTQPPRPSLH